jgi:hypothetical protein
MQPAGPARPDDPPPDNTLITTPVGKPAPWLIEAAAGIGLDYSRLTHVVTSHFKNHAMKRHPDVQPEDFEKIPAIIAAPDTVIVGALRSGSLRNVYVKRLDGAT